MAVTSVRVITGSAARRVLQRSLSEAVRAIGGSLGPSSKRLMYDAGTAGVLQASDGLSIARQVCPEQGVKSVAPKLLKETLWEVQRDLHDGTARVACMVDGAYGEALRHVAHGMAPIKLGRAIERVARRLPALLAMQRCPMPSRAAIAASACDDDALAHRVAELFAYLPEEGALEIIAGVEPGIVVERFSGYCVDVGDAVIGPTALQQRQRFALHAVHVLVVNEVLDDFGPLLPVLEQFVSRAKSLLIVARGFTGAARAVLSANHQALTLHVIGVTLADVAMHAVGVLEDLCVVTGATLVSEETGTTMASVRPAMLGRVESVVIENGRAVFAQAEGEVAAVLARRQDLERDAQRQRHVSLDRERLLRRAARLRGGWAQMRVAGRTMWETEAFLVQARAALHALRASEADGVVPGGGKALERLADMMQSDSAMRSVATPPDEIEWAATQVVAAACRAVRRQIVLNDGAFGERTVVDPLCTTTDLLRRSLSLTTELIGIEVLIA